MIMTLTNHLANRTMHAHAISDFGFFQISVGTIASDKPLRRLIGFCKATGGFSIAREVFAVRFADVFPFLANYMHELFFSLVKVCNLSL